MIDTDVTGQKRLDELLNQVDSFAWNEYESEFIEKIRVNDWKYKNLSPKQKAFVGRLYDKLLEG